jgi:hypothetical protein
MIGGIKMPSGGARIGAGRKSKAAMMNRYVLPEAEARGISPLEYMLRVVRDPNADVGRRDRMAIAAAPYCHPRIVDRWVAGKEIKARNAKHAAIGTEWEGLIAYPARRDDEAEPDAAN